jgi:hypothetical protein
MSSAPSVPDRAEPQVRGSWPATAARIFVLVCVVLTGAWYEAAHNTSLLNSDIWLHLRTGEWILQNHKVPHRALFTQHSDLEWVGPSWGFDLLVGLGVKFLGLRAIPLLLMSFKTALAIATFLLAQGWHEKFWPAAALTAVAQYICLDFPLQPAMVSALLLAIELGILLESRRSGGVRLLRWLPMLFICWANLDVQFVNGLLVLGLYVAASLAERGLRRFGLNCTDGNTPLSSLLLFSILSAATTLVSPYFYRSYLTLLQTSIGSVGITVSDSLHSMSFRQPQHYALLVLIMAAFFTLGRQRSLDWFKVTMIVVCAAYAFHWQQDMWFAALPAVAVIADGHNRNPKKVAEQRSRRSLRLEGVAVAVLTMLLFALTAARIPSQQVLFPKIIEAFPVKAADSIRQNHLQGPLYNAYAWGGFLAWYMPEHPVAIDGRIEMYGKRINDLYFETATGLRPLSDDPTYNGSRTFLLKRESRLADMITHLPGFRTVYSDNLAVVMERLGGNQ